MSRRVALSLPGRSALLPVEISTSDEYESLMDEFHKYAVVDPYLANKLTTHFPVFEFFDKEFDCDMQILPSMKTLPGNKLTLRFVPNKSPMKQAAFSNTEIPTPSAQGHLSEEFVLNIVHAEKEPSMVIPEEDRSEYLIAFEQLPEPSTSGLQLIEIPPEEHALVTAGKVKNKGAKTNKLPVEVKLTPDDITLPNFSDEVKETIKSGRFLTNTGEFVRENGRHIVTLKKKPKKEDYEAYVSVLLTSMPEIDHELKVGKGMSVGEQLLIKIRNYVRNKMYRKPVPDHKRKRGPIQTTMEPRSRSPTEDSHTNAKKKRSNRKAKDVEATDSTDPFKAMKKKKFVARTIIDLLPTFKEPRREAIASKEKFPTIKSVVSEWPPFQNPEVIVAEFLLCSGLSEERMKKNFDTMVSNLQDFYQEVCDSEGHKIRLFNRLETELEINYHAYPMAFSIEQLGANEKPRLPGKILANAPASVSYLCSDGKISRCYLLAEAKCLCYIEDPTAWDVYKLLVGSYYCFHRKYPLVSKNTLDFFDCTILETINQNNSAKLSAFKKKYFK